MNKEFPHIGSLDFEEYKQLLRGPGNAPPRFVKLDGLRLSLFGKKIMVGQSCYQPLGHDHQPAGEPTFTKPCGSSIEFGLNQTGWVYCCLHEITVSMFRSSQPIETGCRYYLAVGLNSELNDKVFIGGSLGAYSGWVVNYSPNLAAGTDGYSVHWEQKSACMTLACA